MLNKINHFSYFINRVVDIQSPTSRSRSTHCRVTIVRSLPPRRSPRPTSSWRSWRHSACCHSRSVAASPQGNWIVVGKQRLWFDNYSRLLGGYAESDRCHTGGVVSSTNQRLPDISRTGHDEGTSRQSYLPSKTGRHRLAANTHTAVSLQRHLIVA